jgi:hypothetical protein
MAPRSPGRLPYDFAVYDRRGQLFALIEARRRFGTTPSWAREWHEGVMEEADRPVEASVWLVTPDRIYVWRPGAGKSAHPDWTLDAGPWLDPYFIRLKIPAHEVAPHVFDQIVGLWLREVADGVLHAEDTAETASDLLSGVRGGEVVEQMAA